MSYLSGERERILVSNREAIESIVKQAMAVEEAKIVKEHGENWRNNVSLQLRNTIEESLRLKHMRKISEVEEYVWQVKRSDSYGRTLKRK